MNDTPDRPSRIAQNTRRDALRLALQATSLSVLALPLASLAGCSHAPEMSYMRRSALLEALVKLVLPHSDPAQVLDNRSFLFRSIDRAMRGVTFAHLDALAADLDARAAGNFLELPRAKALDCLAALDSTTFAAAKPIENPWFGIKAMILIAYFTSSPGMEDTLVYDLVPGRYDPDVHVDETFKPLSNDWSAVRVRIPLVAS